MSGRFTFEGVRSELDITAWVEAEPRLRRFRDNLAKSPGGRERAQQVVERLVGELLTEACEGYTLRFRLRMREVVRIRGELNEIYGQVLALPGGTRRLPPEINVDRLQGLFRELDQNLEGLSKMKPLDGLDAADRTLNADDVIADIESGGEGPRTEVQAPDVLLDDPELAAIENEYPHLPEHQRKWVARRRLQAERRVSVREQQRIARLAARERARYIPEDVRLRARLQAEADLFANNYLPPEWTARLRRLPTAGEADIAQLQALSSLDPNYLANGFELYIRTPEGDFNPDGLHFLDSSRTNYEFLEHKEPLRNREQAYYDTPAGREELKRSLEKRAAFASQCRGRGCQGFVYSTGQEWMDNVVAEAISEIRKSNPELGRLLSVRGRK